MKTYSEKELFAWLAAQPDEMPIEMGTGIISQNKTGCVMGEFLKSKGIKSGHICMNGICKDGAARIDLKIKNIFHYFDNDEMNTIETVGSLKKTIKNKRLLFAPKRLPNGRFAKK